MANGDRPAKPFLLTSDHTRELEQDDTAVVEKLQIIATEYGGMTKREEMAARIMAALYAAAPPGQLDPAVKAAEAVAAADALLVVLES